ncbi:DUF4189 domain-containing protein [Mycobacterium sp. CBMA293]|uniref:DUF4189 domain-containing protein n=1 Tax=Mycolicibacterium sp. CBMA 213 TaxID=1968788 RepID=A0A1S6GKI3_9MYCO|nr:MULTISPECIES: DUF4189 domain-containing protein [unclassified Mycolicibacterium]AQS22375.1 hypothetical protein pCBMA213_2_00011 [Mycolicibacterium sp. CBMA 213]MUL48436.1 DUF4189 domain-containing protein [Mycolicibacterium sp. CBMA 360]MUL62294.1 DUF4189 domain-containing protein [Mycolicibacterium sp. CBMA 335]MUM04431.1 hypothetical protein [Mycolicibacterium sp. CBMA 213]MUM14694.1 DUF4189 domain-containing protein [Mycolicibacterium sp. CBMA 293]
MTFTVFTRRAAVAAVAMVAASTFSVIESTPAGAAGGYGAIAYSSNGASGWATGYASRQDAGQAAVNLCGYTDCSVLTSFTGCGAVARSSSASVAQGGSGTTLARAETRALRLLGTADGYIDAWACN